MHLHPSVAPVDRPTPKRRRRRRLLAVAALGAGLALAACTPSGYQGEQVVTARVHRHVTGQSVSASQVQCGEFTSTQTDVYTGICSVNGWSYAVTSDYASDHQSARIDAGRWDGPGGWCTVVKTPNGTWGIFNWAGAEVCDFR